MNPERRAKMRGVAVASAGFALALAILAVLKLAGVSRVAWSEWGLLAGVTAAVQLALWLIPRTGLDARLRADPRFIYLPALAAALLLNLYVVYVPAGRALALMGWLVVLLLLAGLIGFQEVLALSAVMVAGYVAVLFLHLSRGAQVFVPYEATLVLVFMAMIVYVAAVFARLRRTRLEMQRLRRELADLASKDELTGLPNRRVFEATVRAEVRRLMRYGGTATIAMIDVDFFKTYNDVHGHLAGDEVLRRLAELMRKRLRTTDVLARFGGEEFTLLMVSTPKDEAVQALDRLRVIVEGYPFEGEDVMPGGHLTISAGLSSFPEDGTTYEVLMRAADSALYRAKHGGRNRVVGSAA